MHFSCLFFFVQVKPDVWATLLALIWLHGFKIDAQVEWQFLAMKAAAWIRSQKGKVHFR